MRLRTLFIIGMILALLFALILLLGPATILKFFGFTTGKTEVFLAQAVGAGLVGFGLLCWFAKDFTDPQAIQGTVLSLFLCSAIAFVVTLLAVFSQVTRGGWTWLAVVLFFVFAVGFAYFQFFGPRE